GMPEARSPPIEPYLKCIAGSSWSTVPSVRKRTNTQPARSIPNALRRITAWRHACGSRRITGAFMCRRKSVFGPGAGGSGGEAQREIDQAGFSPPDLAEVESGIGIDEADLVADFSREQRSLGVVEHDALAAIEPARGVVYARDDGADAGEGELVLKGCPGAVGIGCEHLSLPGERVDETRDQPAPPRSGTHDRLAGGVTDWDRARGTGGEELIQLALGFSSQVVEGHGAVLRQSVFRYSIRAHLDRKSVV